MSFPQESGFSNFAPAFKYLHLQVTSINLQFQNRKIKLVAVDACQPNDYQNQHTDILVTNNWVSPAVLESQYYEQFPDSFYGGLYSGQVSVESVATTKKFNCFINRMDPIRQSWLYQLIRRNLFELGYVSFNMDISRHNTLRHSDNSATPMQVFEQQFRQHLDIFGPEHDFIKSQVPYRSFDVNTLPDQIIMQSNFSIVLETYFDCNEIITYSEKIFRCLKLPRPWVMFAMQHAVQGLRDMGFDVLDDLVDHSYDTIDFAINRQVAILDQIEVMCENQLTTSMIARCEQAAEHNQKLLSKLSNTFNKDVDDTFKRAVAKCLQL